MEVGFSKINPSIYCLTDIWFLSFIVHHLFLLCFLIFVFSVNSLFLNSCVSFTYITPSLSDSCSVICSSSPLLHFVPPPGFTHFAMLSHLYSELIISNYTVAWTPSIFLFFKSKMGSLSAGKLKIGLKN